MNQPQGSSALRVLGRVTSLGSLFVVLSLVVVGGDMTPGYDHASQYISELGATGAPHEWAVRLGGFLPAGLLFLAFCVIVYRGLPRAAGTGAAIVGLVLYGAGYLVAVAFPCDPGCRPSIPSTSQLVHNIGGLIGYVVVPASLFVLARRTRLAGLPARVERLGLVASGVSLFGLVVLLFEGPWAGLGQRALEASVLGWCSVLGWSLHGARGPAD